MINPFKTCKLLLDPPPGGEGHDTMMNDMKHGEMGELLPQHEEDGVQVIDVLAEEIPPGHIQGCIPILENENGTVVGDYINTMKTTSYCLHTMCFCCLKLM